MSVSMAALHDLVARTGEEADRRGSSDVALGGGRRWWGGFGGGRLPGGIHCHLSAGTVAHCMHTGVLTASCVTGHKLHCSEIPDLHSLMTVIHSHSSVCTAF